MKRIRARSGRQAVSYHSTYLLSYHMRFNLPLYRLGSRKLTKNKGALDLQG